MSEKFKRKNSGLPFDFKLTLMSTKAKTVLMLCGDNKYYQLGEKSNVEDFSKSLICPPVISHIDMSHVLSYSIYSNHAVWSGGYERFYIVGKKEKEIQFIDDLKNKRKLLSVVCGDNYTLYLYSIDVFDDVRGLAYSFGDSPDDCVIYPKKNGKPPKAIFGGIYSAAAIDVNGGIILLSSYCLQNKKQILDSFFFAKS